ncbi:hypothetical protein [Solirubrobacter soli]|uniref:hypothetical protein n=1 Tax=Solirubrobacter soli TaxID=363832 RepID=UPI000413E110|nr:hypothetical protein [Solirubrobacter soli]
MVPNPVVVEVVAFEALRADERGSRRAIVRWSDGTTGEALRWYDDEVLVCEGDLIGKTIAELRTLHFARDKQFLRDEQG